VKNVKIITFKDEILFTNHLEYGSEDIVGEG
jgi:hypothetical protein